MNTTKTEFAAILEEARELERKVQQVFRNAEDSLPKHQRSPDDRQQALLAIDSLQVALIRANAMIQE